MLLSITISMIIGATLGLLMSNGKSIKSMFQMSMIGLVGGFASSLFVHLIISNTNSYHLLFLSAIAALIGAAYSLYTVQQIQNY